jgi:hypothetical protein
MITLVGWDIGGVNTKGIILKYHEGQIINFKVANRYFEIWKDQTALVSVLRSIEDELVKDDFGIPDAMALTMTAELSDVFRTKRDGVEFVLDTTQNAFPETALYVLDIDGDFISPKKVLDPLRLAATNWVAMALFLARWYKNCVLIDIGSTTTDIIPIKEEKIVTHGYTDTNRLVAGELVYTGILRTPISSVVSQVPVKGSWCRVSAEYFAILGDVYLILETINDSDYVCETPDKRPKTKSFAKERLARVVCADSEALTEEEIVKVAWYIHEKQIQQITEALMQVYSRISHVQDFPVIACGLGEFLAKICCNRLGLEVKGIGEILGPRASTIAPCIAVASLLAEKLV